MRYDDLSGNAWRQEEVLRIDGGVRIAQLRGRSSPEHGRLSQKAFCLLTEFPEGTLKSLEKPGTDRCRVNTALALAKALAVASGSNDPAAEFELFVNSEKYHGRDLQLRCRFLVPFEMNGCPPHLAGREAGRFSFKQCEARVFNLPPQLLLYCFSHGIGVWSFDHEGSFSSISAYASYRRSLYRKINQERSHEVNDLTRQIQKESGRFARMKDGSVYYVLSLVELLRAPWTGEQLDNGLKLLSWPSLLLPHEVPVDLESSRSLEQSFLTTGIAHREFCPFGVAGIVSGYASWAGVSMHVHDPLRSISFDDLTKLEISLQSVWSLIYRCKNDRDTGAGETAALRTDVHTAKRLLSQLADVDAKEHTLWRLTTEAVVATSRIETNLGRIVLGLG